MSVGVSGAATWGGVALFFFALDSYFRHFHVGSGPLRFAALAVLVAATVALARTGAGRGRLRSVALDPRPRTALYGVLVAVSLAGGLFVASRALRTGVSLGDQSVNTVGAARAVLAGRSPYASELDFMYADLLRARGEDDPRWHGYKYGPLAVALFAPLGLPLGEAGIVLTDALAVLAVAAALVLLHRSGQASWPGAVALAAAVFGARHLAFAIREANTDPPAVALALFALWAAETGRGGLAGALLGASASVKVLPAAAYAVVFWPMLTRPRFVIAFAGTLALLWGPAVAAAPGAFARNYLLFGAVRPADSTSIYLFLPQAVRPVVPVLGAALFLIAAASRDRSPVGIARRVLLGHLAVLGAGSFFHNNYLLWLYPVLALFLLRHLSAPTRPAPPSS